MVADASSNVPNGAGTETQSSTGQENEAVPKVQLRNKNTSNGAAPSARNDNSLNEMAQGALERAMGTLYENSPEMEDNNDEIRRLDTQLDHMNEYMEKLEKRLNDHNEKLRETLKEQRENREKRRQSFHERLESNRQEDDDFQKQVESLMNQILLSKQRPSSIIEPEVRSKTAK